MALPTSRAKFKEFILQNLGKGVIRIEVSDQQVENQIDFALAKFQDYHFDGSQEMYYKYEITAQDIQNGYVEMPADTLGAVDIFDLSSTLMGSGIWNAQYQWVLSNVPNWSSLGLADYWMTMMHLQNIQYILVGKQPIRHNRYENKLYVDMDWSRVVPGNYLMIRYYKIINPESNPRIWTDQWLIKYATALVKRQWGNNLKKYPGTPLVGGVTLSGQQIYDEAVEEIDELDKTLINSYSIPIMDMIG
mgnify:CR=1 FL=1